MRAIYQCGITKSTPVKPHRWCLCLHLRKWNEYQVRFHPLWVEPPFPKTMGFHDAVWVSPGSILWDRDLHACSLGWGGVLENNTCEGARESGWGREVKLQCPQQPQYSQGELWSWSSPYQRASDSESICLWVGEERWVRQVLNVGGGSAGGRGEMNASDLRRNLMAHWVFIKEGLHASPMMYESAFWQHRIKLLPSPAAPWLPQFNVEHRWMPNKCLQNWTASLYIHTSFVWSGSFLYLTDEESRGIKGLIQRYSPCKSQGVDPGPGPGVFFTKPCYLLLVFLALIVKSCRITY